MNHNRAASRWPRALFRDRRDAGRSLARKLSIYAKRSGVVVLGLPRGGVPVAYEVAAALEAPLDVYVVRKLGAPRHADLAIGAIATGGVRVLQPRVIADLGVREDDIARIEAMERIELERRERSYRDDLGPVDVRDQTVILVDDGMATGSTMTAAVLALRASRPEAIVVGVPIAARDACAKVSEHADAIVCARTPEDFNAVGVWYEEFPQTTDAEVRALLSRARSRHAS